MPTLARNAAHVHTRLLDLDRLRRYLRAVAGIADRAARERDPGEVLAAAEILRRDAPRGLAALGAGR